ncbi:MAG: NADP-dependent oxidoreductase [Porticoccaceae bacterium]
MPTITRIRMGRKPDTQLAPEDFAIETTTIAGPGAGEVAVRPRYFSLDPYLVGMMRSWQGPDPRWGDGIIVGRMVGEVIESTDSRFAAGDLVKGESGWQSLACVSADTLEKVTAVPGAPISVHLGVLGTSGLTAWVGINRILAIEPGETVTISSAAGVVGGIAGQLAKKVGARVIGIAGGAEKCRQVVAELGFDACVDHQATDLQAELAAVTGQGVDAHFENVGAKTLDPALAQMRDGGRIALCGLLAHYQDDNPVALANFRRLLSGALTLRGFRLFDFTEDYTLARDKLAALVAAGDVTVHETITDGLEQAPRAFLDMLAGHGSGKHILRL